MKGVIGWACGMVVTRFDGVRPSRPNAFSLFNLNSQAESPWTGSVKSSRGKGCVERGSASGGSGGGGGGVSGNP